MALPPTSKIHNVFHYYLLEFHEDHVPSQIADTPPLSIGNDPIITLLTILDFKTSTTDGTPTRYALV